jgi:hypothetical protein
MEKPSKRFMKHGFLLPGEYNQNIHNNINTEENMEPIYQRNINYNTNPSSTFYTPEEIEEMKNEIKLAQCSICDEKICDDRCRVCQIGHKFHNFCYDDQRIETTKCPTCRSTNIKPCYENYNDTFSGGKTRKQKKKTRKQKKKTRKQKKKYKRIKNRH